MGRRITVDLSEEAWLILSEKQFEMKKKAVKAESLSKMVANIVDEKLLENNKATSK
jgi:hypothetical protein